MGRAPLDARSEKFIEPTLKGVVAQIADHFGHLEARPRKQMC